MSYTKMVSDFVDLFKKEPTGVAAIDIQKHADDFATAVDNYVKSLKDPANRPVKSTTKSLMIPPIIAIATSPGTGVVSIDAQKAALQYAIAIQLYTLAIVIDPSSVMLLLGGIKFPPGVVSVAQITAPAILTTIQNDFKDIFTEDTPNEINLEILIQQKATKFADAIKKGFTEQTIVTISGVDSPVPPIPPTPFSIVGPLSE